MLQIILILLFNFTVIGSPGESPDDPIPIDEGITLGTVNNTESLWYSINLEGNYEISLNASVSADFDMALYNSSLDVVQTATSPSYPDIMTIYSRYGLHYIEVYPYNGDGDFILNVTSFPVILGDSERNPILISEGTIQQTLDGSGDFLWYQVDLAGNYEFVLSGPNTANFDLYLYNSDLERIGITQGSDYPNLLTSYSIYGSFFIQIHSTSGAGDFTLVIKSFSLISGDHYLNPLQIGEGTHTGNLPGPSEDGSIWYSFNFDGKYRFMLTGAEFTDFEIYLYTTHNTLIDSATASSYPEIMTTEYLYGTYLIEIYPYDGVGNYSLTIVNLTNTTASSPNLAQKITPGSYTGAFPGPADDYSYWYLISLDGNYTITLKGPSNTDFDMKVYDKSLVLYRSGTATLYPEIIYLTDVNGEFYINIYPYQDNFGEFSLEIYESANTSVIPTASATIETFESGRDGDSIQNNQLMLILVLSAIVLSVGLRKMVTMISSKRVKNRSLVKGESLGSRRLFNLLCDTCETFNEEGSIFCQECGSAFL